MRSPLPISVGKGQGVWPGITPWNWQGGKEGRYNRTLQQPFIDAVDFVDLTGNGLTH
jgi:hypothetical protein